MGVGEAIVALGAGERRASFDQFSAAIAPQWIADALAATDTASVRRPKLPAEHVVWLVIGMGCGAGAGARPQTAGTPAARKRRRTVATETRTGGVSVASYSAKCASLKFRYFS